MTPAWILDVLAALMIVVAAVSATRICATWRRDRFVADTDAAHLLMAIAMAGMLAPRLAALPDTAWEIVFCLLTAWFASRVARDARTNGVRALAGGHCAPHLVHSASMLYMFLAATAPAARVGAAGGMGGMSAGAGSAAMTLSVPTLAFVFAFVLVGYGVWDIDQLSGRRYATAARVSLAGAVPVGAGPVGGVPARMPVLASAGQAPDEPAADDRADTARAEGSARTDGDRDHGGTSRAGGAAAFLLSPGVTVGCRIAMGVTMAFMLLIAL